MELNVIITNIIGGLGNQMFQYAAGKALASRLDVPLYLDLGEFSSYGLHNGFELNRIFNLRFDIADSVHVDRLLSWRNNSLVKRILRRKQFSIFRGNNLIFEPSHRYWAGFHSLKSSIYLNGYWQSERYFNDFKSLIANEFTFAIPLEGANLKIANKIINSQSISVHIRRGDYVSSKSASSVMGVCSKDYYNTAINLMCEKIDNPIFFVFSDDIDWAKKNIGIRNYCIYVDHNTALESYRDMQLMSLCKHNIIANSSFSWWGAWLNNNVDKIVMSPINWFAANIDSCDIVPDKWIRI